MREERRGGAPGEAGRARAGRPAVSAGDVIASVVMWTVAWGGLVVWVGGAVFTLAFLDDCPPESCSTGGALGWTAVPALIALVLATVSVVWGAVALVRRRRAWPAVLAFLAAEALVLAIGVFGTMDAIGWWK